MILINFNKLCASHLIIDSDERYVSAIKNDSDARMSRDANATETKVPQSSEIREILNLLALERDYTSLSNNHLLKVIINQFYKYCYHNGGNICIDDLYNEILNTNQINNFDTELKMLLLIQYKEQIQVSDAEKEKDFHKEFNHTFVYQMLIYYEILTYLDRYILIKEFYDNCLQKYKNKENHNRGLIIDKLLKMLTDLELKLIALLYKNYIKNTTELVNAIRVLNNSVLNKALEDFLISRPMNENIIHRFKNTIESIADRPDEIYQMSQSLPNITQLIKDENLPNTYSNIDTIDNFFRDKLVLTPYTIENSKQQLINTTKGLAYYTFDCIILALLENRININVGQCLSSFFDQFFRIDDLMWVFLKNQQKQYLRSHDEQNAQNQQQQTQNKGNILLAFCDHCFQTEQRSRNFDEFIKIVNAITLDINNNLILEKPLASQLLLAAIESLLPNGDNSCNRIQSAFFSEILNIISPAYLKTLEIQNDLMNQVNNQSKNLYNNQQQDNQLKNQHEDHQNNYIKDSKHKKNKNKQNRRRPRPEKSEKNNISESDIDHIFTYNMNTFTDKLLSNDELIYEQYLQIAQNITETIERKMRYIYEINVVNYNILRETVNIDLALNDLYDKFAKIICILTNSFHIKKPQLKNQNLFNDLKNFMNLQSYKSIKDKFENLSIQWYEKKQELQKCHEIEQLRNSIMKKYIEFHKTQSNNSITLCRIEGVNTEISKLLNERYRSLYDNLNSNEHTNNFDIAKPEEFVVIFSNIQNGTFDIKKHAAYLEFIIKIISSYAVNQLEIIEKIEQFHQSINQKSTLSKLGLIIRMFDAKIIHDKLNDKKTEFKSIVDLPECSYIIYEKQLDNESPYIITYTIPISEHIMLLINNLIELIVLLYTQKQQCNFLNNLLKIKLINTIYLQILENTIVQNITKQEIHFTLKQQKYSRNILLELINNLIDKERRLYTIQDILISRIDQIGNARLKFFPLQNFTSQQIQKMYTIIRKCSIVNYMIQVEFLKNDQQGVLPFHSLLGVYDIPSRGIIHALLRVSNYGGFYFTSKGFFRKVFKINNITKNNNDINRELIMINSDLHHDLLPHKQGKELLPVLLNNIQDCNIGEQYKQRFLLEINKIKQNFQNTEKLEAIKYIIRKSIDAFQYVMSFCVPNIIARHRLKELNLIAGIITEIACKYFSLIEDYYSVLDIGNNQKKTLQDLIKESIVLMGDTSSSNLRPNLRPDLHKLHYGAYSPDINNLYRSYSTLIQYTSSSTAYTACTTHDALPQISTELIQALELDQEIVTRINNYILKRLIKVILKFFRLNNSSFLNLSKKLQRTEKDKQNIKQIFTQIKAQQPQLSKQTTQQEEEKW